MPTLHTTPTYTANAAGNIRTSASLAASATDNTNVDYSAVLEGQIHVKNTPGGSVAATRGLRIEIFRRYGSTPTTAETAMLTYTLPSATASTAESIDIFLGPGKYNVKVTNLDATNAITVEITGDTITDLATA
jgi:hypothetical protein